MYQIRVKEFNIKNRVNNYYSGNLIKPKKLKNKNKLINDKNYKKMVICFTIMFTVSWLNC